MEEAVTIKREEIYAQFEEFFSTRKNEELTTLATLFPQQPCLELDYSELQRFNPELADNLVAFPDKYIPIAEDAMRSLNTHALIIAKELYLPKLRLFNLPDVYSASVQNLGASQLDKIIRVEGTVSWITDIYPRMQTALWECVHCWQITTTTPDKTEPIKPPTQCKCGRNHFNLLEEKSEFVNLQRARIQELVEKLRGNSPTSHVDLWLETDLVNKISPGEKLVLTGVLRLKPNKEGKGKSSVYSKYMDVIHLHKMQQEFEEIEISKEEEQRIKELASKADVFEKINKSIAPSIYGYNELKQAVALQLFGGTPNKRLPDGHTIRNDTHILLIGDPGIGKSAILQYIVRLAPKAVFTSGKGTSGVGLCVEGDSLVELNDAGLHEIGQLIEAKFKNEDSTEEEPGAFSNEANLKVATLDLDQLKTGFAPATKIWKIKAPQEMIGLTTSRGKHLALTTATPILVFENSEIKWKKSGELTGSEWIASSRAHPALKGKPTHLLPLVYSPNIYIANSITPFFTNVTDKIAKKKGSLQNVASTYGITRDLLYAYRLTNHRIPLDLLRSMCKEAEITENKLLEQVTKLETGAGSYVSIPLTLTPKIAYLAGVVAGDGDLAVGKHGGIRITSSSVPYLKYLCKLFKEEFTVTPNVFSYENKTPQLRVASTVIRDIFTKLGAPAGEKSHLIDLPPSITQSGVENVAAFIRGWMDTDGYVALPKHGSASIGLTTASKKAARKLLILFEWFGVTAKLRIRDKRGKISVIQSKKVETKQLQYQLEIRGKENFEAYAKNIGFWRKEKQAKLENLLSVQTKSNTNVDVLPITTWLQVLRQRYHIPQSIISWTHIRNTSPCLPSRRYLSKIAEFLEQQCDAPEANILKVLSETDVQWEHVANLERRPPKSEWVYDFTIPGQHAFLANGLLVHNTASAEKDELTGGWILKAGAMVLASGGMVLMDEFDKMSDDDRSALHEAMEQQKISIAKAGMVTTFQTKAAILAAANPKFGRFDPNTPPATQFDIPATLISRFDLIFAIRDILDEAHDRKLVEHIVLGHTLGASKEKVPVDSEILAPLEPEFLRKYVAYARRTVFPQLTPEAIDKIKEFYIDLRQLGKKSNTFPITARQVEGVIRLAEASAKVRLSQKVELQDAERAIGLVSFVLHDIFMDKETGVIDSDIVNIGQPKSKVDKLRTLINVINSLEKQFDVVEVDDVVKECAAVNIDEPSCRKMIDDLKRQGDLYEPRPGQVKTARKKTDW